MSELLMTSFCPDESPSILLEHSDHFSKLHTYPTRCFLPTAYCLLPTAFRLLPSSRLQQFLLIELGNVDAAHGLAHFFRAFRHNLRLVIVSCGADNGFGTLGGIGGLED